MTDQQPLIIGVTIGSIALLVIIIVIIICVCCRKAERSCLKRKIKKADKQHEEQRHEMTIQQKQRRDELDKKHEEIRNKYGIQKNGPTMQQPRDDIFSVENQQISIALK